jgi:hypothetical protein
MGVNERNLRDRKLEQFSVGDLETLHCVPIKEAGHSDDVPVPSGNQQAELGSAAPDTISQLGEARNEEQSLFGQPIPSISKRFQIG